MQDPIDPEEPLDARTVAILALRVRGASDQIVASVDEIKKNLEVLVETLALCRDTLKSGFEIAPDSSLIIPRSRVDYSQVISLADEVLSKLANR